MNITTTLVSLKKGYNFTAAKPGKYKLYIVGGLGLKIKKRSKFIVENKDTGELLETIEKSIKPRTILNFEKAIYYGDIIIPKCSKYQIRNTFVEGVELNKSRLLLRNFISDTNVPLEEIKVVLSPPS